MSESTLIQKAKQAYEIKTRIADGEHNLVQDLEELETWLDGKVYLIPADRLARIQSQVERSAKAAMAAGLMPPMLREIEHGFTTITVSSTGMRSSVATVLVLLQAGALEAGSGWQLVAGIIFNAYRVEGELHNMIHSFGKIDPAELAAYRVSDASCDHCHTRRRRVRAYLLRSPNGKLRQVGTGCLVDYIGQSADAAAKQAEKLLDLGKLLGESETRLRSWSGGGGGYDPSRTGFFDPQQYLGWVARAVRLHGWTSRSQAWDSSRTSSADRARSDLLAALGGEPLSLDKADLEEASETMDWIQSTLATKSALSQFESNLVEMAGQPLLSYRQLASLAPAVVSYQSYRKRIKAHGDSKHIGKPGERLELDLQVSRVNRRNTPFGVQHIYQLEDGDGNQIVWFSSGSTRLEVGKTYKVRGTVKRHETYGGVKRTVLTNCRAI